MDRGHDASLIGSDTSRSVLFVSLQDGNRSQYEATWRPDEMLWATVSTEAGVQRAPRRPTVHAVALHEPILVPSHPPSHP
jgi:hypothetical protein